MTIERAKIIVKLYEDGKLGNSKQNDLVYKIAKKRIEK